MNERRLIRTRSDRMFLGVAGGIARYLDVDPVLVRLFFVLIGLSTLGKALLIYLLLAIIMPEEGHATAKGRPFDEDEIVIKEA